VLKDGKSPLNEGHKSLRCNIASAVLLNKKGQFFIFTLNKKLTIWIQSSFDLTAGFSVKSGIEGGFFI